MVKYKIKEYSNGIMEIKPSIWCWSYKPQFIKALEEISKSYFVLTIYNMGAFFPHYVITTKLKDK